jgi:hypothetical protein
VETSSLVVSRTIFCPQCRLHTLLSAEAIWLRNFARRRSVRGSRMVIVQQLCEFVSYLFAVRRHYLLEQKLLKVMRQARP